MKRIAKHYEFMESLARNEKKKTITIPMIKLFMYRKTQIFKMS
jgi:hypothetical protein